MPALLKRAIRTLPHEVPAELPVVIPYYIASGGRPLPAHPVGHGRPPEDQIVQLTMPRVVITGQHDGFAPPAWARHLAELASASCVIPRRTQRLLSRTRKPLTRHYEALPTCTKTIGSISSGPKRHGPSAASRTA